MNLRKDHYRCLCWVDVFPTTVDIECLLLDVLSQLSGDEVVPGRVENATGTHRFFISFFGKFGRVVFCQVVRSRFSEWTLASPFVMVDTTSNGGSLGSRVDEDRSKARQGVVNCRIQ